MMISPLPGVTDGQAGLRAAPAARHRGRPSSTTRPTRCPTAAAATWCSPSRGRRCCAPSGATTSAILDTYWSRFEGKYFAGDGAKKDDDGDIWLLGRVDDVMLVSGHNISTTEVESALVSHPTVAEAAVVGAADATTGQAIVAFVILRGTRERRRRGPRRASCATTSPRRSARSPSRKRILLVAELPKTRSGKIMRRLLRDVAENRQLGDVTTLTDSAVMDLIQAKLSKTVSSEA